MFDVPIKLSLVAGFAAISIASGVRAETVVLRYNQYLPAGHWSQTEALYPYFDEIARVTEGRVTVEPSAKPLAPPNRNYQAVKDGIADIVWGPHGYNPGAFPLSEMVEFPFITGNVGIASQAYWELWKETFEATGMHDGVVTLALHVTSGGNIHLVGEPVTSVEEMRGLKLRMPTPGVGRALHDAGVVPVSGAITELREMMARGIVDGTAIADEFAFGYKIDPYVNSVVAIPGGMFSSSAFIVVSRDKWDRIAPADQAAIMDISGAVLSRHMGDVWQRNNESAQAAFRETLGDNYVTASDTFVGQLEAIFAPHWLEWVETAAVQGVQGEAALTFYRDAYARIEAQE